MMGALQGANKEVLKSHLRMIDAMTPVEKADPSQLTQQAKERIAAAAKTTVTEINQMVPALLLTLTCPADAVQHGPGHDPAAGQVQTAG